PLRGDALAGIIKGLWSGFPDLSFEIASKGLAGPDLVAAEWVMRGTNSGSMMGMPPTVKAVTLRGADFIRVRNGKIQSVDGYFDRRGVPDQLGLNVVVQRGEMGPVTFGTATRAWSGSRARPGAFSITAIEARSEEDARKIQQLSQRVVPEMFPMKGFLGFVG